MWLTGRLAPDFKTVADFRKEMARLKKLEARMHDAPVITQPGPQADIVSVFN